MIGSPVNEAGRTNGEIRHEVVLTEGFWLADTTNTQALREAVMGDNPNQFRDAEVPESRLPGARRLGQCRRGLQLHLLAFFFRLGS